MLYVYLLENKLLLLLSLTKSRIFIEKDPSYTYTYMQETIQVTHITMTNKSHTYLVCG